MDPYTALFVSFVVGVLASLLAAYVYGAFQSMKRISGINIEGDWAEHIPDSKDHQYSLGKIYYDRKRKLYAFDGTNFLNDGRSYCYWDTVTSVVDTDLRKFFYTFTAQLEGELDKTYYGFGVINLGSDEKGVLVPTNGHYISDNVDAQGMSHSMLRSLGIKYVRGESGQRVIRFLDSHLQKQRRRPRQKQGRSHKIPIQRVRRRA